MDTAITVLCICYGLLIGFLTGRGAWNGVTGAVLIVTGLTLLYAAAVWRHSPSTKKICLRVMLGSVALAGVLISMFGRS